MYYLLAYPSVSLHARMLTTRYSNYLKFIGYKLINEREMIKYRYLKYINCIYH